MADTAKRRQKAFLYKTGDKVAVPGNYFWHNQPVHPPHTGSVVRIISKSLAEVKWDDDKSLSKVDIADFVPISILPSSTVPDTSLISIDDLDNQDGAGCSKDYENEFIVTPLKTVKKVKLNNDKEVMTSCDFETVSSFSDLADLSPPTPTPTVSEEITPVNHGDKHIKSIRACRLEMLDNSTSEAEVPLLTGSEDSSKVKRKSVKYERRRRKVIPRVESDDEDSGVLLLHDALEVNLIIFSSFGLFSETLTNNFEILRKH